LVSKPDQMKLFQGKYDELNHLVPLTYDLMQTQLKRSGSLNSLAEEYTKSFLDKLSNVGSEDLLHE